MTAAAPPLADRARKARHASVCGLCGGPVVVGQRIARLTEGGRARWCHASCVVSLGRASRQARPVAVVWLPGDRPAAQPPQAPAGRAP